MFPESLLEAAPGLLASAAATAAGAAASFPRPLEAYTDPAGAGLLDILRSRVEQEPFNLVATGLFLLAILHTFGARRFTVLAHHVQDRHDAREREAGREPTPSFRAEVLHFLGEIEVIFGLWALPLGLAITGIFGRATATHYANDTVNYSEPLFVVVIMALASTQPVLALSEAVLRRVASLGGASPAAWWLAILTIGPLFGSFITEPAAMTISALLLSRQFYAFNPSPRLAYATLGLLFVNVSVGGTLSHFAAPPVLMVARPWHWGLTYMLTHFGWKALLGIVLANATYFLAFRRELLRLGSGVDDDGLPSRPTVPGWITAVHLLFMFWTVVNAHYPALFVAGFLFFLGFARATAPHQTPVDLRSPLLVGFFLAGLVIHGGLQAWWIAPVLGALSELPLFFGALVLTAFNDNALITFLATLVPNLSDAAHYAVVAGAVGGGGLTVIANAPNPAGQAILGPHFEDGISPLGLFLGALLPTAVMAAAFLLL
jgi:hypothetical protein